MEKHVNRGDTVQVNWALHSIAGEEFSLSGYSYKLQVSSGNQTSTATGVTHSGNILTWTFVPDAQWKVGNYTMWLDLISSGEKIVTLTFPDVFQIIPDELASGTLSSLTQGENVTIDIESSCDFYRFAPVVPVVGEDGYWYVNGKILTDEDGDYIKSYHTVTYDPETEYIYIDRGQVDAEGRSIEQVITAIADATSYAETDHAVAIADHGTASDDHLTAVDDHQRAEQDAATARADHSYAVTDHVTATEDHTTAVADHETAVADHGTAVADHETAVADHGTALIDHGNATHLPIIIDGCWALWNHSTQQYDKTEYQAQAVPVVDNVISGGTTKALSAEQGKILAQRTLYLGGTVEQL